MKDEFVIDAHEVLNTMKKLTGKEIDAAIRRTVTQSANILVKETKDNFKHITDAWSHKNSWNGRKLIDGIKKSKYDKKEEAIKVHICGDYRLQWFELGTKDRWQKKIKGRVLAKPRYIGKYTPHYFFRDAVQSTEQRIFEDMDKRLSAAIMKIANK